MQKLWVLCHSGWYTLRVFLLLFFIWRRVGCRFSQKQWEVDLQYSKKKLILLLRSNTWNWYLVNIRRRSVDFTELYVFCCHINEFWLWHVNIRFWVLWVYTTPIDIYPSFVMYHSPVQAVVPSDSVIQKFRFSVIACLTVIVSRKPFLLVIMCWLKLLLLVQMWCTRKNSHDFDPWFFKSFFKVMSENYCFDIIIADECFI